MTKAAAKQLRKNTEVFNVETGEVAKFIISFTISSTGEPAPRPTTFVQGCNSQGQMVVWGNHHTEKL